MTIAADELEQVGRRCVPDVLAALVRRYGDFDAAEDAVQEALLDAAQQWSIDGLPDNPKGWLITVASRRLVDQLRSEQARTKREQIIARRTPADGLLAPAADTVQDDERDDSMTLLLLCCHPALTKSSQVALTLRAVAGLSTAQIARSFLVPEATMAQRISRAKTRLRKVGARFDIAPAEGLPDRVAAAAHVLYLIFTEGHTATTGTGLSDNFLADEAIRLTRQLHQYLPAAGEVTGLLALMLLTHARRSARSRADGTLVPLAEQNRSLWDRSLIDEGVHLIEAALPTGPVGPYQLQAAIAAVHAEAQDAADTDWVQIETLYRMLNDLAPSPVVTLNHAVAVAMVDGPATALAMIQPLLRDRQMSHAHRLHAVHAHLLEMNGQIEEARVAYATAARLATSIPEQRYLNTKALQTLPTSRAPNRHPTRSMSAMSSAVRSRLANCVEVADDVRLQQADQNET
jgi:RNA polymerase sigma factor (sigma-70 family)